MSLSINQIMQTITKALDEGNLIDTNLQVVNKHGWQWKFKQVVNFILFPFHLILHRDPYSHVRSCAVAQALLSYCKDHSEELDTDIKKTISTRVFSPLLSDPKYKHAQELEKIHQEFNHILPANKPQSIKLEQTENPVPAVKPQSAKKLVPTENPQPIEKPRVDVEKEKIRVREALANFSHGVHLKLAEKSQQSICFAPISIFTVLGMLLKAASAENKAKLLQSLHLDDMDESKAHLALSEVLQELIIDNDQGCCIKIANGMALTQYGNQNTSSTFKEAIKETYKGEIFTIKADPEAASKEINQWVAEQTNQQIPSLLSPDDVKTDNTLAAILLNAMYFSGKWKNEFEDAELGVFKFANAKKADVMMMSQTEHFRYYEDEEFKLLEMPYVSPKGHQLSQLIFLPKNAKNLSQLEQKLTPQFIRTCLDASDYENVHVTIPKLDANSKVDTLKETLADLGFPLNEVFPALGEDTVIGKIIHQAKLKNDEKGTVGAAATAAVMIAESCCMPSKAVEFIADHDYAYMIMDRDTVLFRGDVKEASVLVPAKK